MSQPLIYIDRFNDVYDILRIAKCNDTIFVQNHMYVFCFN